MPTHKARYKGSFFSENGRYNMFRIYQKGYTGQTAPLKVGGGGVKIQYDNSGQDKFSPIMSSKCSISLIVENNAFGLNLENFIYDLQTTFEEGDVNLVIWNTGNFSDDPLWSGNILVDLGAKEDVSKPYEVELTATDGLGLLKNYDMVKTQGTNPYVESDTYYSEGYKSYIYWIKEILALCNVPDNDSTDGVVSDYKFSTAVDWWYESHPTAGVGVSPLAYTQAQMLGAMELTTDGYQVKNAYEVLESICKMWGMKVVFWKNKFYFTQLDLYNTPDTGTFAAPNNIDTQIWDKDGTADGSQSYIGSTFYTLYTQEIQTNNGGFDGGLQKLAGSTWNYYPKLKEVRTNFANISNNNYYTSFPQPDTLMTKEAKDFFATTSLGTIPNASGFGGFNLNLSVFCETGRFDHATNTYTPSQALLDSDILWGIRAKPSADSDFSNGKYLGNLSINNAWIDWPGIGQYEFSTPASTYGTFHPWTYILDTFNHYRVPAGNWPNTYATLTVNLFNGILPTDAAFTGSWDFELFTYHTWLRYGGGLANGGDFVGHSSQVFGGWTNGGNSNLDMREGLASNPSGIGTNQLTARYSDILDANNNPTNQFNPVYQNALGATSVVQSTYSSRNETAKQEVKNIYWGDAPVLGDTNALIYDNGIGTTGYTDPQGKWRKGQSGTYDKTLAELVSEARLYSQQSADYKWSLVTAVSSINPWFRDATGSRPFYINPVGRIYDQEEEVMYYMLRGTFNMTKDEWDAEWVEISYDSSISTTSQTTTTGGSVPDNNVINSAKIAAPPNSPDGVNISITTLSAATSAGTGITSLSINQIKGAEYINFSQSNVINSGDKFVVFSGNAFHEFTASADVGDTDESISVVSTDMPVSLAQGATVSINTRDLYKQYQHKTRGTIGGMAVTSTTIDGAGTIGRETITFRVEGSAIASGNYYVSEGEDNNKSGRWSEVNSNAPISIGTVTAMKGARGLIVNTAILEKGRVVISGNGTPTLTLELYKVSPVDNASAVLSQTLMATCTINCNGNAKPRVAEIELESSEEISPGDLIIPTFSTSGESVSFRGVVSYTLKYT